MATLNERIEELCTARGMTFRPHECPPWEADDGPSPWPPRPGNEKGADQSRRPLPSN